MSVELQGAITFLLAFQQRIGVLADAITGNVRHLEAIDRIIAEYDQAGPSRHIPARPAVAHGAKGMTPAGVAAQPAKAAAPSVAAKPAAKPSRSSSPANVAAHAHVDRKILDFLRAGRGPYPATMFVERLKLSSYQVKDSLKRLRDRGLVQLTGTRASARWGLAKATAATPGASVAPGRRLNGTEFETVWDGSKERKGEAPSLLGDRTQRSA